MDMYVCVERSRLNWYRNNQNKIKAKLYSGALEAFGRNDLNVGRNVILPATFTGGPRSMSKLYRDATAIVTKYGQPAYFITMTTNPDWKEIQENLLFNQTAQDRPDLVIRVFYMKLAALLEDVIRKGRLGRHLGHVWAVEYQKRNLPHVHLILWVDKRDVPLTGQAIDSQISAEIPDVETNPDLYAAVAKFMLHGPCVKGRKCFKDGSCKLKFPRPFQDQTTMPEDSYPSYKKPDLGRIVERNGRVYTSGHVVPYHIFLLLKYQCHLNV